MKRRATTWCVLAVLALGAAGCTSADATNQTEPEPAVVVEAGADEAQPATLTVSALAEQRLGIRTEPVQLVGTGSAATSTLPYAALVYDAEGDAWAFSAPRPHTYVRVPLGVGTIDGDQVRLTSGPPVGTQVVVVGAPELVGAEAGISGEE